MIARVGQSSVMYNPRTTQGGVGQDHVRAIFAQSALLDVGFLVHTFLVGSKKIDWCWSFSSKEVIETSLRTIIFLRTSVEPERFAFIVRSSRSRFAHSFLVHDKLRHALIK